MNDGRGGGVGVDGMTETAGETCGSGSIDDAPNDAPNDAPGRAADDAREGGDGGLGDTEGVDASGTSSPYVHIEGP